MGGALLEVRDLHVSVDASPPYDIVQGVDLALDPGDVFGLVGESGSGKTTTALAVLGFARERTSLSGSVVIEGTEMIGVSEAAVRSARRSLVSYVPQDPSSSLNPALRIGDQLVEKLAPRRWDRRHLDRSRITELLARVQLPTDREFLRRYPHQLSGGQLQRVCIAMAMLHRPRLIIFDEPTTGLDVTTQGYVLDTIRTLIGSEEASAIYVTHDLAVIGSIATRIGVMYSGLLVEEAPTDEILLDAVHPYAKKLIGATPSVARRRELVGISGTPLNPRDRKAGCPFLARCDHAAEACVERLPEFDLVDVDHRVRCHRPSAARARSVPVAAPASRLTWETADDKSSSLLVLAGVHASYGDQEVVHEVDFAIADGECLALVGESGSGKTTLARCVSGIHRGGVEGYLGFAGERLAWQARERPAQVRREIQYIFQNPYSSLNPRHTIGRIIAQPLETFGLGGGAREHPAGECALLESVALPADYTHRYPSQLSGGERQRVAIARALAAAPRLMVCDEITSSLDVSIQASILELLGQLRRKQNLTMLFITHNLGVVRAIADDIVIVQQGRVMEQGSAESILDEPSDPYTVELLANTPVLAESASV